MHIALKGPVVVADVVKAGHTGNLADICIRVLQQIGALIDPVII